MDEANAVLAIAAAVKDDSNGSYIGGGRMIEALIRRWKRLDQPGDLLQHEFFVQFQLFHELTSLHRR